MAKKTKIKIVNAITLSRLLGTVALPLILLTHAPITIIVYIVSLLLTDLIDGMLARKWDVSTLGGSLLDAISDKIFGIPLLGFLATVYPPILLSFILEGAIGVNNFRGTLKGANIKSSKIGKLKTAILGITSFLGLLYSFIPSSQLFHILKLSLLTTIITQSVTISNYSQKIKKIEKENKGKSINFKELINILKTKGIGKEILFNPEFFKENFNKPLVEQLSIGLQNIENNKTKNKEINIKPNNQDLTSWRNSLKINYNLNDQDIEKIEAFMQDNNLSRDIIKNALEKYNKESFSSQSNENVIDFIKKKNLQNSNMS